jgi:small subunit ribosomal protein S4
MGYCVTIAAKRKYSNKHPINWQVTLIISKFYEGGKNMARYTGSSYRKSRRLGFSILETGKELLKRPFAPGQHGQKRSKKLSNYGIQLKEKQKLRFMYGLNERQFKKTFVEASKLRGVLGEDFLKLLESRLDNLVYRIGFAKTRRASRQLVNHGHITVNGKKVDIASYRAKPGDVIGLKEASLNHPTVKESLEAISKRLDFIKFDDAKMTGTYVRYPERSELNVDINEALIVEFYNR